MQPHNGLRSFTHQAPVLAWVSYTGTIPAYIGSHVQTKCLGCVCRENYRPSVLFLNIALPAEFAPQPGGDARCFGLVFECCK